MMTNELKKALKTAIKKKGNKRKREANQDDSDDDNLATILATCVGMVRTASVYPRHPIGLDMPDSFTDYAPSMLSSLHDTSANMGWDTDAALTITCLRGDMLWIDDSDEAIRSIPSLQGINGGSSIVGGVGPCLVRSKCGVYLIDPEAVYLTPTKDQPLFRVAAAQRFKAMGVRLVQCYNGTTDDVLECMSTGRYVTLTEEGGRDRHGLPRSILVLSTQPVPKFPITNVVRQLVKSIKNGNRPAMLYADDFDEPGVAVKSEIVSRGLSVSKSMCAMLTYCPAMIFNEAKCSLEERTRLYVRRLGYPASGLLERMCSMKESGDLPKLTTLNEDSLVVDSAKFKRRSYKRKDINDYPKRDNPPWWIAYSDGYGGGESLGGESYDGAVGGYLFVCPASGDMIHKLYASQEQYPSALFQFYVEVEAMGFTCKEMYIDTFTNNISAETEEVAAMFQCRLIPVSAGSPQEVAFVETAHRVIAGRSRAMLFGAPHLPKWCWALADKYAVYIGRLLPQSSRE